MNFMPHTGLCGASVFLLIPAEQISNYLSECSLRGLRRKILLTIPIQKLSKGLHCLREFLILTPIKFKWHQMAAANLIYFQYGISHTFYRGRNYKFACRNESGSRLCCGHEEQLVWF